MYVLHHMQVHVHTHVVSAAILKGVEKKTSPLQLSLYFLYNYGYILLQ